MHFQTAGIDRFQRQSPADNLSVLVLDQASDPAESLPLLGWNRIPMKQKALQGGRHKGIVGIRAYEKLPLRQLNGLVVGHVLSGIRLEVIVNGERGSSRPFSNEFRGAVSRSVVYDPPLEVAKCLRLEALVNPWQGVSPVVSGRKHSEGV